MYFDEGLHYSIDELSIKFMAMRIWMNNRQNESSTIIKFEDMTNCPVDTFKTILNNCNISINDKELKEILADYSKDKMREKDIAKRKDKNNSHYRRQDSKHEDIFKKEHFDRFYSVTGNLVDVFNYER